MPHSALAMSLRMGVIESEILLQMKVGHMQAYAAIHAHPNADVTDAFKEFKIMYQDVKATIPYVTAGKGPAEQLQDERMTLVHEYEMMRASKRTEPQVDENKLHVADATTKQST